MITGKVVVLTKDDLTPRFKNAPIKEIDLYAFDYPEGDIRIIEYADMVIYIQDPSTYKVLKSRQINLKVFVSKD